MRPKHQAAEAGIQAHGADMRERRQKRTEHRWAHGSHAHTYMVWSHTTLVCFKHFHHLRVWEGKTEQLKVKHIRRSHFTLKS